MRMLPSLWFRIHADIGDYLIQRGANGVPVLYWYHRQFIEGAKDRYVRGEQEQFIPCNMSDYFLGNWADGNKKPFVNKNGERIHMDSLVAKQPLSFQINQEQAIFNYRKLTGLPHHLFCSA
ncbi:unnamed protein product [Porites evermanni]|uniref:Tyrosinase n=1 Tax=Porites evermanni TaxID=104178 RepID=A0ABN8LJN7_9CNID|nr:unnamed protein product [Porites evermanni]